MPDIPSEFWPDVQVGETATFTYDATALVTDRVTGDVDPIVSAQISTMPSGTGELAPLSLTVALVGAVWLVTAEMSGGVAGRDYINQIILTTEGGLVLPVLIGQVCSAVLRAFPDIPPPPSPFFGTPVTWTAPSSVPYGILGADGAQLLGADGASLQYAH